MFTDAQRYVALVAQQRYSEALEYIMENNPLPGSIGHVCVHPCESACRRSQVDQPIAICALKRFVVEQVGADYKPAAAKPSKGKKVAVIGAGPSGLTAAHDLARLGFEVTIIERQAEPGGMLRSGILAYRLPRDVLARDIANIIAVGIDMKTGVEIGKDMTFPDIQRDFDAVLIAVGLSVSRGIPLEGAELDGVLYAVPFLQAVNYGQPVSLGEDIIVIGGGNVAIDVARSARRLGDKKVKMVCLEARGEMPAHDWEVEQAIAEGIEVHCSYGPHRIIAGGGRVAGLEFKQVDCVFDEQGRFNPQFREEERVIMDGDTIIFAIGQGSDLSFLAGTDVAVNERGQLVVDRGSLATTEEGVFATGEVAMGPGAAIQAIAAGHKAAVAVAHYLDNAHVASITWPAPVAIGDLPEHTKALVGETKRQQMPAREASERVADFETVELGFSADAAVREAQRCMACGAGATVDRDKCIACLTCVRVCPYEVPVIEGSVAVMEAAECQSCGICAPECPAQAIKVRLTEEQGITQRIEGMAARFAASEKGTNVVGFVCQYGQMWAAERLWQLEGKIADSVEIVDVLCLGRVSANHLLAAFEIGADKVFAMPCGSGNCHNKTGNIRLGQKIDYVKSVLAGSGMDPEILQVVPVGFGTSISGTVKKVVES